MGRVLDKELEWMVSTSYDGAGVVTILRRGGSANEGYIMRQSWCRRLYQMRAAVRGPSCQSEIGGTSWRHEICDSREVSSILLIIVLKLIISMATKDYGEKQNIIVEERDGGIGPVPDSMLELTDYSLLRHDRIGKGGGGVGVYIHHRLHSSVLATSSVTYESHPEFMIIEVYGTDFSKLLLFLIYRPPNVWKELRDLGLVQQRNKQPTYEFSLNELNKHFASSATSEGNTSLTIGLSQCAISSSIAASQSGAYKPLRASSALSGILIFILPLTTLAQGHVVVCKIATDLGMQLNANDIDYCYRSKPKSNDTFGSIRVRFNSLQVKENLLKRDFSTRHLTVEGIPPSDLPIYINESLCFGRREVLNAAREAKKTKKYAFLWIRGGKILMRKAEKQPVIVLTRSLSALFSIKSICQMVRIFGQKWERDVDGESMNIKHKIIEGRLFYTEQNLRGNSRLGAEEDS
ncbi:hypothetical protein J437_LFUL010199 [Ladona fulva]|uniref:FP protein C-terminal domain-containing protein n=1 Tax=Ladona fulva TaxID=123851 RepID=A0A8K0NZN6_LADFU|nr:hypothetical protein J437_LFUL010199 [Ladona fulva]